MSESRESRHRLVVALDVDGVLASWSEGWKGIYHFGPPIPGAVAFTRELSRSMKIIIHTCRCNRSLGMGNRPEVLGEVVTAWLQSNGFAFDEVWTNPGKPIADVYIDDRAISCRPEDGDPDDVFQGTLKSLERMFNSDRKRGKQDSQQNASQKAEELPFVRPFQGMGPGPDYRTGGS